MLKNIMLAGTGNIADVSLLEIDDTMAADTGGPAFVGAEIGNEVGGLATTGVLAEDVDVRIVGAAAWAVGTVDASADFVVIVDTTDCAGFCCEDLAALTELGLGGTDESSSAMLVEDSKDDMTALQTEGLVVELPPRYGDDDRRGVTLPLEAGSGGDSPKVVLEVGHTPLP